VGWLTEAGPDASPSSRLRTSAPRHNESGLQAVGDRNRGVLVDPHPGCLLQKRLHPRPMQALLRYLCPRVACRWITRIRAARQ
jgi:hypothetical protein